MPPSLSEELAWIQEHARWIKQRGQDLTEERHPALPRFKDCVHCPERWQCETEEARRVLCGACPYGDLPDGPRESTLVAMELATLPGAVVVDSNRTSDCPLDFDEWQALNIVRNYTRGGF